MKPFTATEFRDRIAKQLLLVPVLAEPLQASDVEPGNTTHTRSGKARESTKNLSGSSPARSQIMQDSCGEQNISQPKETT